MRKRFVRLLSVMLCLRHAECVPTLTTAQPRFQEGGHEARHRRVEILVLTNDANIGKLRMLFASKVRQDAFAQGGRTFVRSQNLDLRDQRAIGNHGPARLARKLGDIEAGLLLELAPDAEFEIDFVADDVLGIGRAAGK